MKPTIEELSRALQLSWNTDTAYNSKEWSQDNKARGQCVVSSLVVQDYLGGDLIRYDINQGQIHETHYMNQLANGVVVDTTASQYISAITMTRRPVSVSGFTSIRDKRLADPSTAARYNLLKSRVEQYLAAS